MNKVYRLVWSALHGTWVCAAECARSRGKTRTTHTAWPLAALLATTLPHALAQSLPPPAANALPSNGRVVAGQAQITQPAPASLVIQQSTQRAAIDWQSFNIGASASVNFQQPSAQSVTLNRVLDTNASQIFGRLSANGQVFLSNPSGVYFAPGASVDVGGLVATTMSISNEDFMAGRMRFERNGATAGVLNLGRLSAAPGGYVALLAPEVRNEGVIVASAGTVALAAGEAITLDFGPTSGLARVAVTPAQVKTLIENRHAVLAEGGQIILAARSAENLLGSVVHSGTLSATSIVDRGGVITIEADAITLAQGSRIEATGATGGGTVLVGGGWQGSGGLHQATSVTMAPGARIDASATAQGDGGTVVLWSDVHDAAARTTAQGSIAARGGPQGGNGGRVETSGAQLAFDGLRVDSSAPRGATGLWLADPYDLTVDSAAASTINTNLASSNVTLQTTASGTTGPGTANASGNGDIHINSALSWSSGNTLTLDAYRNININAAISAGNTGKVVLITGDTAGNGTSGSATGDYSFGLGSTGFAGSISFGSSASTATLKIAQGGTGAASDYTLIYDLAGGANGLQSMSGNITNNYALAKVITGAGASTTSVVGSFGNASVHTPVFTGLGNRIDGLTMTTTTPSVGLFGTNYATIRDIGVTNFAMTQNAANLFPASAPLAGIVTGGKVLNSFVTGTINGNSNSNAAGLVGKLDAGTIDNAWSSVSINAPASGQSNAGLISNVVSNSTVSNSYATGSVTTLNGQSGGLIGIVNGTGITILNTHATGAVSSTRTSGKVGGLIGAITGGIASSPNTITNSYATGTVFSGGARAGGLIGDVTGIAILNRTYATGNVTGSTIHVGGLIGSAATGLTVNTSYALGHVSGTSSTGGLIGSAPTGVAVNDAYAQGSVTSTNGSTSIGGLIGNAAGGVFKNVYASGAVGLVSGSSTSIGGLLGTATGANVSNGYWDTQHTGRTQGYGANTGTLTVNGTAFNSSTFTTAPGGRTTAQLQDGTLPTGYNAGTPNGMPWATTSGLYPYFGWQFPNGTQKISGTGYTSAGAGASDATIKLYANGNPINGGAVATNASGGYTALVNAGTVTAGTKLGATFTLSGASSISGASYTDAPTLSSGNVTGFDLKQGLFLATTTDTTNSALQTSLGVTFGSSTYSGLTGTLGSAWWQFNAGGSFTLDTPLSHAGSTAITAGGNLAINADLVATNSTVLLSAGGNVTESSVGGITASNLVLVGGTVALNSTGIDKSHTAGGGTRNDVATLAASGVSSLSYVDKNALTIGSVGPYQGGVTAATINGVSTTTSGLSAAGNMSVFTTEKQTALTLAGNVTTAAGAPDSTLTLRSGGNVVVNDGVSIGVASGATNKLNTVLWTGWDTFSGRGAMAVGSASINTNGGLFWAGGQASNDCTPSACTLGQITYGSTGVAIGAGHSTVLGSTSLLNGAAFTGTTVNTGGGDLVVRGRHNKAGDSGVSGTLLHNVSFNAGGGNIDVLGILESTSTGVAAHLSGTSSLVTTGTGGITITGTNTSAAATPTAGVKLASTGANTINLQTTDGAINVTGTTSHTVAGSNAVEFNVAAPATGHIKIGATTGAITISGDATSTNADGIRFTADGAASAGAVQIGAVDATAYSGALTLRGSSIVHGASTTTAGAVALKGSGAITFDSPGTSFAKAQTLDNVLDIGSDHSSLTVGKTTNTADVTLSAARTVAGPISVYGGNLSLSGALTDTGAPGTTAQFRATGDIALSSGITSSANPLNVILWSDTDGSGSGSIAVSGSTITTNGGQFWAGGGTASSTPWNGLTVGSGYAITAATSGDVNGVTMSSTGISTGAGHLYIAGKYAPATAATGTSYGVKILNSSLTTTTGDLSVEGQSSGPSLHGGGIFIVANAGNGLVQTTSGAISLKGTATDAAGAGDGTRTGIYAQAFTAGASMTIQSESGAITLDGQVSANTDTGSNNKSGVILQSQSTTSALKIVSNSNEVTLKGAVNGDAGSPNRNGLWLVNANAADVITIGGAGATGAVKLQFDSILQQNTNAGAGSIAVLGTGAASVTPVGASFTALRAGSGGAGTLTFDDDWNFGSTHGSVTIGSSSNTLALTLSNALTAAGPITVGGGNLSVAALSSTAPGGVVTLESNNAGTVTQTGAITANGLHVLGAGTATLTNSDNNVVTLAADDIGTLSYVDSNALTIGTVDASSGIDATGTVSVATLAGDLGLSRNVATTNGTASAITLNAGQSSAAGTASGGNIVVSGSPVISTGAGGRATLYSGSATGDGSLAARVGTGSGRFRYNSDEAASNFTTALGTGLYGIYRESRNTAIAVGNTTVTYGTEPTLAASSSGLLNGDTATLAVDSPLFSSSGNHRVGSYGVSASNISALVGLGYTSSGNSSGTLTVSPKALSLSGLVVNNRSYDGTAVASVVASGATYSGLVAGDALTVSATGSFANKNVGSGKTVTLASSYSGADVGNYTITDQASTTASITQKALTVSGLAVANRAYDGTTTASVSTASATYGGLVAGDAFTVSATGAFADKNVGSSKNVSLSSSYSGADVGNYAITNQVSTTADITARALSIGGITAANKVYDATTAASVSTASATYGGLVSGDAVSVSATGVFSNKNVGTGKTVTLASSYSGADAGNYSITNQASTTANITAKSLTIDGITAANKVYDGNTNATTNFTGATYTGRISGDDVSVASATGAFVNKNVGNAKSVTLTSSYAGVDAGNYAITDQASTTANITSRALTVSQLTVADRVYDGTAVATVVTGSAQYTGRVVGDAVTVSATGAFANKNVGAGKSVTLSSSYSGADVGNYTIADQAATTANITPASLTVSTSNVSKVYDGATTVIGGAAIAVAGTQLFGTDSLSGGNFAYTSKNVGIGNKVVVNVLAATVSDGNGGANYSVSYVNNTSSTITPKALTIGGITAASKVYDGNTNATTNFAGATYTGRISGDDVSVASATGAFVNKNVGNGKSVTLTSSYSGADVGNYTITGQADITADITPKALMVSGLTVADRGYDGSAVASVVTGGAQYAGLLNGDAVTVAATGSFADKNVGAAKTVTLSSGYSGADVGNYSITSQASTAASITPTAITVGTANVSKVYDGTTSVSGAAATLVGGSLFGTDALAGGSFAYTDKNVGAGNKIVTIGGVTVSDGNGGANYTVGYTNNTTSTITPKALTVSGITAANKTHDGNTAATVITAGANYAGLVGGDAVVVAATGTFADRNAGTAKTVTLASSYSGVDVDNYTITSQMSTTADITRAALTVTANADAKFVTKADNTNGYNGVQYSGFVGGDTPAVLDTSGLLVTRPGMGTDEAAGTYAAALVPSGVTATNYTVGFAPGSYTIVPAHKLLIRTANSSVTYGTGPVYSTSNIVAQYLKADNTTIHTLSGEALGGNRFKLNDGVGGSVDFTLKPGSGTLSGANTARVGNHIVNDANPLIVGSNFNGSPVFVGNLAVMAKGLTASASNVSKVYDGSTAMTGVTLGLSGQLGGDVVTVNGGGAFSQKNVGTNLGYTISGLALAGPDGGNYFISGGNSFSGSNGEITRATLTIGGIAAANKVYDGGGTATVNTATATYTGRVSGDDVVVAATGSFANKNVGTGKTVTLASSYSGADLGNYTVINQASTTADITPKTLVVSGLSAGNRAYDGTVTATIDLGGATYTGLVGADLVSVAATGSFANRHVGNGKLVTLTSNYSGADVGNYTITSQASTTADITPAAITVSTANVSKVYDGGTGVTDGRVIVTGGTLYGSDALSGGSFAYTSKNVGNGNRTVTVSGVTIADGNSGADYLVTHVANTTSSITPKGLTIGGISAASKVYDGGVSALTSSTAASYTGLVSGDDVHVSATGGFANKNVGSGKTVTLASSYSGADVGNYTITDQASTTASITQKALTVSGLAVANRAYDGTTTASVSTASATYGGLVAGDAFTVSATGAFADKNVGSSKNVSLSSSYSGADVGNYAITNQVSTTADITARALSIGGITAANKVYDATTAASVSTASATYGGLVSGDAVSVSATGVFSNKNVGTGKTVTLASSYSGADAGNYSITNQASTTANITAKSLTIDGITAANKVYDGNTNATTNFAGATYTGRISGDDVSVASATGAFVNKNVGNAKSVTLTSSYAGVDAGNYAITNQASTTANITPKALAIGGISASNKVYDGNTSATVGTGSATYAGLVVGDAVAVSATGAFANKHVGAGKSVAIASSYSGADVGNYAITDQATTTANITPASLTVSTSNVSKVYDGATAAAGGAVTITAGTLFTGDTLSGGSFKYADRHVGRGNKVVEVSGAWVTDGNGGANYVIGYASNTTSSITPAPLTLSTANVSKSYDGSTGVTGAAATVVSGTLFGADNLSGGSFAYTSKDAGQGNRTVNVADVAVNDGHGGGNYEVVYVANTTSTITPAAVTVSTANVSKVYNATTGVTGGAAVLTAGVLFGSDALNGGSFAYADRHAGAGNKTVTVGGVTVSDGNGGANYTVTHAANTTSTITPASLAVSTSNVSKVYDATTAVSGGAAVIASGSLFGGDTLTGGSFQYANRHAGIGNKVVNVSGVTANDGNGGGNYLLSYVNNTTSTITRASLSVGSTTVSKVYDGTLAAPGAAASLVGGTLLGSDTLSGGRFAYTNRHVGNGNKTVTVADAVISDGNGGNNYMLSYVANTASSITPANLTVSAADTSKVYDGTTGVRDGHLIVVSGSLFGGDALAGGNLVYADRHAGIGNKTVRVTGVTVADGNGGADYTLTLADNTKSTITRAALALSTAGSVSKVYDGTTGVSGGSVTIVGGNLFGADALNGGILAYANRNAGIGNKVVQVSGVTVTDGNSGANYALSYVDNTTSTITRAPLTLSTANVSKSYDGTVQASGAAPVVAGGTLFAPDNLAGGSFAYTDKNVGAGNKTVTVAGITVNDGNGGGNYDVAYANNTTSTITPASLVIRANNDAKIVTTADGAGYNGASYSGLVGGESPADLGGSLSIARSNAGTQGAGSYAGVLVPSGLTSSNYSISFANGNYTIVPAGQLLIRATNLNQVYGDPVNFVVSSVQYLDSGKNLIATLSGSGAANAFSYNDGSGGSVAFALAAQGATFSGAGRIVPGNYAISDAAPVVGGGNFNGAPVFVGNLAVTPRPLTPVLSGTSKVYDGNTSMPDFTFGTSGGLAGDQLNTSATAQYVSKNAGTGVAYNVNDVSLTGADAGNYYVVGGSNFTRNDGVITPKAVTVSGLSTQHKVYDAAVLAALNGTAVASGFIASDAVALNTGSAGARFGDKNVGTGKTVSVNGLLLQGADAGNYTLESVLLSADITPRTITVSGAQAQDKVFDGTTDATILDALLSPGGVLSGDVLVLTNATTGSFADSLVGADKAVSTAMGLAGADAGNYRLLQPAGLRASITAVPLAPVQPVPPVPLPPVQPPVPPVGGGPTLEPLPGDPNLPPITGGPRDDGPAGTPSGSGGGDGLRPQDVLSLINQGLIILRTPNLANASGGAFVSVKVFEPVLGAVGSLFVVMLPEDTFVHSDPSAPMRLQATLADGRPLPEWLRFDAEQRSFSGTAPAGTTGIEVMIVARDQSGHEARATLALQFAQQAVAPSR